MTRLDPARSRSDAVLARLRKLCLSLPETAEIIAWGHPTFRAGKKMFAAYGQHDEERAMSFHLSKPRQRELVETGRFYITPYAGRFGWVSLNVKGRLDWNEIAGLVLESYRLTASKHMLAALDDD